MIVYTAGPPGAGKSTLARRISERLGFALVVRDEIKATLMLAECLLPEATAIRADHIMVEEGAQIVATGRSVILDGHGRYPQTLNAAQQAARNAKVPFCCTYITAAVTVRNQRLTHRENLISQSSHDPRTDAEVEAAYAHLPSDTLVVDTTAGFAQAEAQLLGFLDSQTLMRVAAPMCA